MNWSEHEIQTLAPLDDLHIAPYREDSKTPGTLTWIWSVVVDGDLYVRAYSDQASRWCKSAAAQKAGRITAAGMSRAVEFEMMDDAYREKYATSSYLRSMISNRARQATVKITPRD